MTPRWKKVALVLAWPLLPGWPDEARRFVQGPPFRRLLERATAGLQSARRVLNAGAGEGSFSPLLLQLPGVTSVLEIDPRYQSHHRAASDARQRILAGSLTHMPIADGVCDLVLCTEVLEHIPDDGSALDEVCRVLAPGGWLLISVPTPPAVYDPDHVREGYTAATLRAMLSERGLEIVETDYCMHAGFRAIMRLYRRWGRWLTKPSLWTLALLDRFCPIGKPMDLMILARAPVRMGQAAGCGPDAAQHAAHVA